MSDGVEKASPKTETVQGCDASRVWAKDKQYFTKEQSFFLLPFVL